MDNDDDFDIIDNTLNITVDVDDDREDEMEEDEEEQENNNKKNNNAKTDQSIVGYAKTINLNIDLNKAFNWYKENYIGKFDLENNEPPEITANGDYTTTDTNDNNYQEINNYVPPTLTKSIEPNTKKTRSLYSNYFKVNIPPPTIISPITSNGYYKFDGNTLISGTDQDYNLNINVNSISKINVKAISTELTISTPILLNNMNKTTSSIDVTIPGRGSFIGFNEYSTYWGASYSANLTSSSKSIHLSTNTYYYVFSNNSDLLLLNENNDKICEFSSSYEAYNYLYKSTFNLLFD